MQLRFDTTLGRKLQLAIGLFSLLSLPLAAATFSATTSFPCTTPGNQTSQGSGVFVTTGYVQCVSNGSFIGQGGATARADSGGIGVDVDYYSGGFSSFGQASGQIDTTFIISGPGTDPIPVSINFELSGSLGGGTNSGQVSWREIENRAAILANYAGGTTVYDYTGHAVEYFNASLDPGLSATFSGVLAPAGTNCLAPYCDIESPVFYVYPGYVNSLTLWARARVSSANGSGYGYAGFLNTFGFDRDQNVFNLPEGYTVTVEGMNVVDNCVVGSNCGGSGGGGGGGTEVPEPSTCALVGAGLVAALTLRFRARRDSR